MRGRPRVRADSGDMHQRFHACLARKHRDALGGFHVDRLKCALSVFDVETDDVHDLMLAVCVSSLSQKTARSTRCAGAASFQISA
jgi:hypothetical protein